MNRNEDKPMKDPCSDCQLPLGDPDHNPCVGCYLKKAFDYFNPIDDRVLEIAAHLDQLAKEAMNAAKGVHHAIPGKFYHGFSLN